jgi:hypothetical protein
MNFFDDEVSAVASLLGRPLAVAAWALFCSRIDLVLVVETVVGSGVMVIVEVVYAAGLITVI